MNSFDNLVIKIESEQMLEEVRELLVKHGEEIYDKLFYFSVFPSFNFLQKYNTDNKWSCGFKAIGNTEITFDELKRKLEGNLKAQI